MKLECFGFVNFQPENIRQGIYGLVTIVLERAWAALKCDQLPVMLTVGTLGGAEPVGWPRMNLEMHLHLHSELASNEFLTEFAFKIRKIPSGFA